MSDGMVHGVTFNNVQGVGVPHKHRRPAGTMKDMVGNHKEMVEGPPFPGIGSEGMNDDITLVPRDLLKPGFDFIFIAQGVPWPEEDFRVQVIHGDADGFENAFLMNKKVFRRIAAIDGVGEELGTFAFAPAHTLGGACPANERDDVGIVGVEDDGQIKVGASEGEQGADQFTPLPIVRKQGVDVGIVFQKGHAPVVGENRDVGVRMVLSDGADEGGGHRGIPDGRRADEQDSHSSFVAYGRRSFKG